MMQVFAWIIFNLLTWFFYRVLNGNFLFSSCHTGILCSGSADRHEGGDPADHRKTFCGPSKIASLGLSVEFYEAGSLGDSLYCASI